MNGKIKCIIALLITAFLLSACASAGELATQKKYFEWPENHKAAVSLTFDDAIDSQAVTAAPLLKKYGFRGTFFLSGDGWAKPENISKWKVVYENGNEIGSHTINHPCPKETGLAYNSEDYTLERMRAELENQLSAFRALGMYREPMVFVYPCCVTWVGNDKRSYVPVVEQLFSAACGGGSASDGPLIDPLRVNLYDVPAGDMGRKGAEYSIKMVKEAEKTGKWLVFSFHGIGSGWLITETKELEGLLRYLSENRESVWTAPFGRVAEYIRNNR
ncbi:MAG: polysaccharide deacetylase family protein [Syntrophales bacterium]